VRASASASGSGSTRPASGPARAPEIDQPPVQTAPPPSRPVSWAIIAVLIAIGVAAMVIMTLK
jgi:hypothetical protein